MKSLVICFGEVLWDLLPTGPKLGGAPCNLAIHLHTLDVPTRIVSRLGADTLGQQARERIQSRGLDLGLVQEDPVRATGTVPITVSERGEPRFEILPNVAYDHIELTDSILEAVDRAGCLCFGTLIQRSPASRRTLERIMERVADRSGFIRFLDLNLRPNCWDDATIDRSLAWASIAKLNEDEFELVCRRLGLSAAEGPEAARRIVDRAELDVLLITLGGRGALAAARTGETVYDPGYAVEVEDTCGSGDACSAGFLSRRLGGESLGAALAFGNLLGACMAMQSGATDPVPNARLAQVAAANKRIRHSQFQVWHRKPSS